jgi:hypothetical protein
MVNFSLQGIIVHILQFLTNFFIKIQFMENSFATLIIFKVNLSYFFVK